MIFNSQTAQKYILGGAKVIATIRKKGYYRLGQRVVLKVGDKRFYGKILFIAPLSFHCLSRFVKISGFNNVEEWLSEARRLHDDDITPKRYEIVVVEVTPYGKS